MQRLGLWKCVAIAAFASFTLTQTSLAADSVIYVPAASDLVASKLPKNTILRLRSNVTLRAGTDHSNIYHYYNVVKAGMSLIGTTTVTTDCWLYHDELTYERALPAGTELLFTADANAIPGNAAAKEFSYVEANLTVRNGTFANLPLKLRCQAVSTALFVDGDFKLVEFHESRITDTNELACVAEFYTLAPQGTQQQPLACRPTPHLATFDSISASYLPGVTPSAFWLQADKDGYAMGWKENLNE